MTIVDFTACPKGRIYGPTKGGPWKYVGANTYHSERGTIVLWQPPPF